MSIKVTLTDNTGLLSRVIQSNVKSAFTDVVTDLKRTSSAAAPHDKGFLEKNHYRITTASGGQLRGEVFFTAKRNGFDYAEYTHDADYNLGEKSKRKTGGKSKFASGTIGVGKSYLSNTVESSTDGYIEHMAESYHKALT